MSRRSLLLALMMMIGCASGSAPFDDAHDKTDAPSNVSHADAPRPGDGPPPVDAPPTDAPVTPDAAMPDAGGGKLCGDNTQCGAGTCCYFFVCTPGTGVGTNLCFPNCARAVPTS